MQKAVDIEWEQGSSMVCGKSYSCFLGQSVVALDISCPQWGDSRGYLGTKGAATEGMPGWEDGKVGPRALSL